MQQTKWRLCSERSRGCSEGNPLGRGGSLRTPRSSRQQLLSPGRQMRAARSGVELKASTHQNKERTWKEKVLNGGTESVPSSWAACSLAPVSVLWPLESRKLEMAWRSKRTRGRLPDPQTVLNGRRGPAGVGRGVGEGTGQGGLWARHVISPVAASRRVSL